MNDVLLNITLLPSHDACVLAYGAIFGVWTIAKIIGYFMIAFAIGFSTKQIIRFLKERNEGNQKDKKVTK